MLSGFPEATRAISRSRTALIAATSAWVSTCCAGFAHAAAAADMRSSMRAHRKLVIVPPARGPLPVAPSSNRSYGARPGSARAPHGWASPLALLQEVAYRLL